MKRIFLAALLMALLCGCGETPAVTTTAAAPTQAPTAAPTEQTLPMAPDFTVYDFDALGLEFGGTSTMLDALKATGYVNK